MRVFFQLYIDAGYIKSEYPLKYAHETFTNKLIRKGAVEVINYLLTRKEFWLTDITHDEHQTTILLQKLRNDQLGMPLNCLEIKFNDEFLHISCDAMYLLNDIIDIIQNTMQHIVANANIYLEHSDELKKYLQQLLFSTIEEVYLDALKEWDEKTKGDE